MSNEMVSTRIPNILKTHIQKNPESFFNFILFHQVATSVLKRS